MSKFWKQQKDMLWQRAKKRDNREPLPSRTEQGTSSCLFLDFHSFPSTTCREENDMMHNLCTSQWLPEIYQWWIDVQFLPTKVLNSTKFTLDNINPLLSLVLSVLNWLWRYSFSGNRSFRLKSFRPGYFSFLFSSHLARFKCSIPRSITRKKKTNKQVRFKCNIPRSSSHKAKQARFKYNIPRSRNGG